VQWATGEVLVHWYTMSKRSGHRVWPHLGEGGLHGESVQRAAGEAQVQHWPLPPPWA
jgi:hypothetical protein